MSSSRERNDRKQPFRGNPQKAEKPSHTRGSGRSSGPDGKDWLWGVHAIEAALANPSRGKPRRIIATADRAKQLNARFGKLDVEIVEPRDIDRALPPGAVHNGVAMKPDPLLPLSIEEIGDPAAGVLVMLDQVTDPQNVGAIFRSALAFGARGIIVQDRHAPALAGALAKAAVGATERLPHARVTNLSRALERLADLGWRAVGLDGTGEQTLEEALDHQPTVLVMGSEGDGIRRLVAEHCDVLAKIPMPGGFESLNVSNAAAVALYEAARAQRG